MTDVSRKRKDLEDEDGASLAKRPRPILDEGPNILSLSDDVLLLILNKLCSSDLLALTCTSRRLASVASDESLWKRVDTSTHPLSASEFRKALKFVGHRTTAVRIGGNVADKRESVTASILETVEKKCPHLEEFILDGCYVDAKKITIGSFPKHIKKFGLVNCCVVNIPTKESYLFQMDKLLPHVENLDLSNSGWLSNHTLQAICKTDTLSEVNFRGCRRIGEVFVYTALATRFGFRHVKVMDLRDTSIGDTEVPCFGRLPEITHLYFGLTEPGREYQVPSGSESNGQITDRGVIAMCLGGSTGPDGSSKLIHLTLAYTQITDRCLNKIAAHLPLQFLDVRRTNVTRQGIEAYLGLRPRCKVFFDQPED